MRCKVILILLVLLTQNMVVASNTLYPGARALGMAGAYISLADDAWAAWWNPAGLLRSGKILFGAEYTSLYPGLDSSPLDYAAASYVQPVTSVTALSIGADFLNAADQCAQGTGRFSVAARPGIFPVSFGISAIYSFLSYADNEFTFYDPVFIANGLTARGIGLDAGLQAELGRRLTLSAVGRNLISPDMGLESPQTYPLQVSVGLGFHGRSYTPVIQADWSDREVNGNTDLDLAVGMEKWLGTERNWGFRAGYRLMALGEASEVTAGFTARTNGAVPMEFSYGVALPLNELTSTLGRHRAGLIFRFGGHSWYDQEPRVPLPPMVDRRTWETGTDLFEVSLWANRDVQNDSLVMGQFDQIPLNSTLRLEDSQVLYGYFPTRATFTGDDIRDLSMSFRVPRYWFEQRNTDIRLLRLYRVLPDNSLERMPSALVSEDEAYYTFEATLDGIGDFLVASRIAELVMLDPQMVYGEVDSVDIIEASLTFRVSKVWMDNNRIDPETIGLTRVRGGVPLDIECRRVNEDLNYLYYQTDPVSLFNFMIAAREREGLPVSVIFFDHNVTQIRDDQIPDLDRVIRTLRDNPGVFVSVEGHTCSDGTFGYNDGLSRERAIVVARYLRSRLEGINVEIEPTWFGERRPSASNDTEEGRAMNRRVEIVILRR